MSLVRSATPAPSQRRRRLAGAFVAVLAGLIGLQLLVPLRFALYPGDLFWTEQGYRFSWRVMLMEKAGYAQFSVLDVDGKQEVVEASTEYEQIYERFAKLLKKGKSEMDGSPLLLIADAFLLGARENVEEFHW